MIRVFIIEDEKPAAAKLRALLAASDVSTTVVAEAGSVRDAVAWLRVHPLPDLILADIGLSDGLSLEVFKQHTVTCPVIFTTAYDEYLMEAFEYNSINYLLKPIRQEKLNAALRKYLTLKSHFTADLNALLQTVTTPQRKSRLLVKRGVEFISVRMEDVAYFYTEHKVTFLVDINAQRYLLDKTLSDLEEELDTSRFFRLNRSYLVSIDAITKFKPYTKGKILVELQPKTPEDAVVSQENAAAFKEWMGK